MNYQDPTSPRLGQIETTPERFTPTRGRRVTVVTTILVVLLLGALWGFNSFRSH